ncbi:hypothetical protein RTBOTA2_000484, partial [Rhodotorula toruloides]
PCELPHASSPASACFANSTLSRLRFADAKTSSTVGSGGGMSDGSASSVSTPQPESRASGSGEGGEATRRLAMGGKSGEAPPQPPPSSCSSFALPIASSGGSVGEAKTADGEESGGRGGKSAVESSAAVSGSVDRVATRGSSGELLPQPPLVPAKPIPPEIPSSTFGTSRASSDGRSADRVGRTATGLSSADTPHPGPSSSAQVGAAGSGSDDVAERLKEGEGGRGRLEAKESSGAPHGESSIAGETAERTQARSYSKKRSVEGKQSPPTIRVKRYGDNRGYSVPPPRAYRRIAHFSASTKRLFSSSVL